MQHDRASIRSFPHDSEDIARHVRILHHQRRRRAFGEPISTADYAAGDAEDPMVTFELTDQVRETIQQTLYRLLAGRRNIFFG